MWPQPCGAGSHVAPAMWARPCEGPSSTADLCSPSLSFSQAWRNLSPQGKSRAGDIEGLSSHAAYLDKVWHQLGELLLREAEAHPGPRGGSPHI